MKDKWTELCLNAEKTSQVTPAITRHNKHKNKPQTQTCALEKSVIQASTGGLPHIIPNINCKPPLKTGKKKKTGGLDLNQTLHD